MIFDFIWNKFYANQKTGNVWKEPENKRPRTYPLSKEAYCYRGKRKGHLLVPV